MGDIVDIKRKGRKIDVSEMDNEIFAEIESKVQDIGNRANSVRKFLFIHGVVADKVYEVVARTDTESLDINANALYSTKDARITVTILRNSNVAYQKISVPQDH